jgi:hypothetical protein
MTKKTGVNQEQNMKTESGNYRTPTQSIEHRKYEVDSKRCNLEIGDLVTPETIIGLHHGTGQPVRADLNGQVATIYFNPMHDSLMILAVSKSDN